ncbi:MAG: SIR2 family protein, partial [Anaerococcus sp.]|nr:SIR2 family protein [Anaerococcus sp.]
AFYNLGYCDGLLSLLLFVNKPEEAKIPPLFIYEENYFERKDDLFKYISENRNKKHFEYCLGKVQNMNDLVPHFMPWYI